MMTSMLMLAAMWISGPSVLPSEDDREAFFRDAPNDVVEKRFAVRDIAVTSAVWRVASPGMRDLFVNGLRVSPTALPPWTPYARRVLEERFDVTADIRRGRTNVLRVELGNGWYNPLPLMMWYGCDMRAALATGKPCVRATLELAYADGRIERVETDGSWRAAAGRILKNSLYLGVKEDCRRDLVFDSSARLEAGPKGSVVPAADFPKTVVYDRWTAKTVTTVSNGVWLVDMGVNFAGTFRAVLRKTKAGQVVRFRLGERLHSDGRLNPLTAVAGQIKNPARGPLFDIAEERDTVICRAAEATVFEPRFTFHVFRYIEVSGLAAAPKPADFEALAWSADVRDRSSFVCSNPELNHLHEVCRRTFRSNLQSVQSDCPGREKFGYGGDMACTADAFWCNYEMQAFYRKVVRDIVDEAAADGRLTETAPYVGLGDRSVFPRDDRTGRKYAPMGWAVGLPVLLDGLVRYAGDLEIVREAYLTLVRYVELVCERYPQDEVPRCLGDWIPAVVEEKANEEMSALAHWHQFVSLTAKLARQIGNEADARRFSALAGRIADRYRLRFVKDGVVCKGSQGDQLFGLYHGLLTPTDVPAATARLKADIVRRGNSLTTGIFGTKYLLDYLSSHGETDLVGRVVTHRGCPGWFDMLDRGATTLWEHWEEKQCLSVHSNCHPMFGSVDEWLIRYVLGISVCDDAVGCDKVKIEPHAVAGVTAACGWFDTPKGRISLSWKLVDGEIRLDAQVPAGIRQVNAN